MHGTDAGALTPGEGIYLRVLRSGGHPRCTEKDFSDERGLYNMGCAALHTNGHEGKHPHPAAPRHR
jgi:hypothetical protein